ncbi:MAG: hypothetical protein JST93_33390 [Acidobacteria bacterium]|nr:hypothetical protein [Acidobacteriota bacterium]
MASLASILAPCSLDTFLRDYLGQRPLPCPASPENRGRFAAIHDWQPLLLEMERTLRAPVRLSADALPGHHSRLLLQVTGESSCLCAKGEERLELNLESGDALYLPSGWTVDSATPPAVAIEILLPKGRDIVNWLANILAEAPPFAAELTRFAAPATQFNQMRALRRALSSAFRAPELLPEFARAQDNLAATPAIEGAPYCAEAGWIASSLRRPVEVHRAANGLLCLPSHAEPVVFHERWAALALFLCERAPIAVEDFCHAFAAEFERRELEEFLRAVTAQGPFTILAEPFGAPVPPPDPEPAAALPSKGWIPITVAFDIRAPFVSDATVRWMELRESGLDDPFVNDTVERLRKEEPPRRELDTSLAELERIGLAIPPVTPRGFIFHVSHCGSTLVSNALKTVPGVVVASELKALSMLVRPFEAGMGAFLRERWDTRRQRLFQAIFNLLATYRSGEPQPLVLKFPSLGIRSMSALRRFFPSTPCVIVIRDPMEVMVSNRPGTGWMVMKQSPPMAAEVFGWKDLDRPVDRMPDEEFAARVLASYFESAGENLGPQTLLVDYTQLNKKKMAEIGAFFGFDLALDERLDAVMGSYAKDPEQKRPFKDDRMKKQWMANVLLRSSAEVWAGPGYRRLLEIARKA